MNYSKPEIVILANATDAIERTMKDNSAVADSPTKLSINAYEADE